MQHDRLTPLLAVLASVALHALIFGLAGDPLFRRAAGPDLPRTDEQVVLRLEVLRTPPRNHVAQPERRVPSPAPDPPVVGPVPAPRSGLPATALGASPPVSIAAPPAPTAEEWAFAARYTLKNSKAYRYAWGRQVRSMMGAAVEGGDQGMVRFRVEIAPDGTLARLDTLWATSNVAEQRARRAVEDMPRRASRWSSTRRFRSRPLRSTDLRPTGTTACPTRRRSGIRSHGTAGRRKCPPKASPCSDPTLRRWRSARRTCRRARSKPKPHATSG